MIERARDYSPIVDFWAWYQRRYSSHHGPVADLALDKCEQAMGERQWDKFGYWYRVYVRERRAVREHAPMGQPPNPPVKRKGG